jgi:hypothetical protein
MDDSDSFNLDFDSFGPGKTKPSKAAIRVNDLLEATTGNSPRATIALLKTKLTRHR